MIFFLLSFRFSLEQDCCKKQQTKVPDQLLVCGIGSTGNRGPLKILNGIKFILDDQVYHLDSYTISFESFRSFKGPLFRKPITSQELFFAVSYSKPVLGQRCFNASLFFELLTHFSFSTTVKEKCV
jgi:hypothetical protein